MKKKILFLCTENSCRSQMAEGLVNHDFAGWIEACSAGTDPRGLNPLAVEVMAEIGIDISGQTSDPLDRFEGRSFDYVITLCGDARERCPLFFGQAQRLHLGFPDPPKAGSDREELLARYRGLRDGIRGKLEELFGKPPQETKDGAS